jgi:hypothetical protein
LNCEGYAIRIDSIRRFRQRYGMADVAIYELAREGMMKSTENEVMA